MIDPKSVPRGGVLGIDPGSASGCLAYISPGFIGTWPIGDLTERELADLVLALAKSARLAIIEQVGAMPKQGIASAFKFGRNYGALRALLAASGVVWVEVLPAKWQREIGCAPRAGKAKGDHKRALRALAQQLFPSAKVRAVEADALLLAQWGVISRGQPPLTLDDLLGL